MGALVIGTGFWGIFYYSYHKEPPTWYGYFDKRPYCSEKFKAIGFQSCKASSSFLTAVRMESSHVSVASSDSFVTAMSLMVMAIAMPL